MQIPKPVLLAKDEIKKHESDKIEQVRPDLVGPRHLVSCPKKDFHVTSTVECVACGYWLGFFPKDRRKPLAPGNAWSACAHPMGREVTSV